MSNICQNPIRWSQSRPLTPTPIPRGGGNFEISIRDWDHRIGFLKIFDTSIFRFLIRGVFLELFRFTSFIFNFFFCRLQRHLSSKWLQHLKTYVFLSEESESAKKVGISIQNFKVIPIPGSGGGGERSKLVSLDDPLENIEYVFFFREILISLLFPHFGYHSPPPNLNILYIYILYIIFEHWCPPDYFFPRSESFYLFFFCLK